MHYPLAKLNAGHTHTSTAVKRLLNRHNKRQQRTLFKCLELWMHSCLAHTSGSALCEQLHGPSPERGAAVRPPSRALCVRTLVPAHSSSHDTAQTAKDRRLHIANNSMQATAVDSTPVLQCACRGPWVTCQQPVAASCAYARSRSSPHGIQVPGHLIPVVNFLQGTTQNSRDAVQGAGQDRARKQHVS